ncbi:MAG: HicB family protein [Lactobacillus sp.]|nr:MAG: HicB family protein [Lactobacillus sp.]
MKLVAYPAIFDDSLNRPGEYTVTFPDVPSTITDGNNIAEALVNAAEVLGLELCDAKTLPEPTDIKKLVREHPNQLVNMVAADLDQAKAEVVVVKVKKNTSIPADLAQAAEKRGINFSALLTSALEKELQK